MEIPKLKFTKLWTNHDDFPTVETREEVVRSDMQLLFNEIRDYINTTLSGVVSTIGDTLTALQGKAGAGRIGFTRTAAIDRDNVQDAIERVQEQLVNVSQGGIADGAVTSEKVAAGAIGTAAIADAAVTYDKIKDKAVGSAKMADNAVSAKKIASDAVQERHIFDGSVTQSKLAAESVSSAKLAPNAVTNEKVGDKALVESLPVTASSDVAESAVTVQSCKFVYAKALGVVLFQVELRGLSSAEITDGVSLTLSGLSKPPLAMVSCAARVQYVSTQGYAEYTTAPAMLVPDGYLTIRFPSGVVASPNDSIMLSGWYFC
nr:MAG TPA: hypothetical protein [Caudoviricetes sp.]